MLRRSSLLGGDFDSSRAPTDLASGSHRISSRFSISQHVCVCLVRKSSTIINFDGSACVQPAHVALQMVPACTTRSNCSPTPGTTVQWHTEPASFLYLSITSRHRKGRDSNRTSPRPRPTWSRAHSSNMWLMHFHLGPTCTNASVLGHWITGLINIANGVSLSRDNTCIWSSPKQENDPDSAVLLVLHSTEPY